LTLLLPADIDQIIEDYGHLFAVYPRLQERTSIFADYKRTQKRLEVLFPLIEHPFHGITGLHAYEKYNDAGTVETYCYSWKRIIPIQGIQLSHISSWGNDPHPAETTPAELCVNTEPHHHHHDPDNRRRRKDSYIMSLDLAFLYVSYYIESGRIYYRDVQTMISADEMGR
jgi:hypothetical protein